MSSGPMKNRNCTDILFSIFFVLFLDGLVAASIYGWALGDPQKLVIGWDSDQNGCGYSEETVHFPYLYWPEMPDQAMIANIEAGNYEDALNLLNYGVCVKECPVDNEPVNCFKTSYMKGNSDYLNCQYYPAGTNSGAPFRYDSESFLGHFCLPSGDYTDSDKMKDAFRDAFFNNVLGDATTQYFYDIGRSWAVILVASICSVIIAYLYLFMIRYMGGVIIWISVAVTELVLIAAGLYSFLYARPLYAEDDPVHEYLAYTAYVCWGLAVLVILTLICCMNAIQLGIAVFKTTVQYVQANMEIFALPAISCFLTGIWFLIWLSGAVFIFSVGEPEARENLPFITEVKWDDNTRGIMAYHAFALLWINAFIIGCVQFIIGASTVIWYFEVNSDTKGKWTLKRAAWWLCRYHWPSVALGSLVIAISQAIRIVFEYYRKKMGALEKTIPWVKALLCMTGYCLWCLENCVKYMSKNAYIQVALTSKSFCPAAFDAFVLILKNAHRFGFANTIGFVYMLFGCFFITSTTCAGTYLFLTNYDELLLTSPVPTTVVMGVIACAIGF